MRHQPYAISHIAMLRELRIAHFALIDELLLSFAPGLNVLTGETGAGKSMITRAIGLLCGDRATMDLIRSDAEEAEIEGLFDVADGDDTLAGGGLPPADELLVRRVISRSGKGRVYINGNLATAGLLGQIGGSLIHVYGQLEHASLLKPDSHLDLLDQFGKLEAQREQMAGAYHAFRAAADRLAGLTASGEAVRQRLELLRFQTTELRDVHLQRGDEQRLLQERDVLRHAEKLGRICTDGEEALYSSDNAIAGALGRITAQLSEAARIDPEFCEQAELLGQAATQVEEVALALRHAATCIRDDPERLEQIDDRLALLGRLKRKYACEADELLDRLAEYDTELSQLEGAGSDVAAARQEVLTQATHAWSAAREISRARQHAAADLEKRMVEELRVLGMRGGVFRVVFTVAASDAPQAKLADAGTTGDARLSALGADTVEFYLSANPGEVPKPLTRVASGGELSRVMLALKTLTAGAGEVPTLIFDEVDAGVGGAAAEAVGKRLRALGSSRQILCITHLPQIAAQADHHFVVEKRVAKGRTTTRARALEDNERVSEITRMLGGTTTTESQQYARRLLQALGKSDHA